MFYKDMSRLLLTLTFAGLAVLVHIAAKKKKKTAKITKL
jgi:phage-related protein